MISKNNSFKDITEKIKFYISNFTVNIKKIIKKNKLIVISLFSFLLFMINVYKTFLALLVNFLKHFSNGNFLLITEKILSSTVLSIDHLI